MFRLLRHLRSNDFVNALLRDNSPFRMRARNLNKLYQESSKDQRMVIQHQLYDRVRKSARRTKYGENIQDYDREWPEISKHHLIECPSDFMNRMVLGVSASTGGTTGAPIALKRSFESIAVERLFICSLLSRYDVDMRRANVAILRADVVKDVDDRHPPYGVIRRFGRDLILSNAHLSFETIDWFSTELARFKPHVLMAYPSMLEHLLVLLTEKNRTLDIPFVLTSSEMCTPGLFNFVREVLGGRLVDYYGQGERVAMAVAHASGDYYFLPTYGTVELRNTTIDASSNDDDRSYEIVATGHWNLAMPLVRYATGDVALINKGANLSEVESGVFPFCGIQGRRSEYVVGPNGEIIGGLNHIPRDIPGLVRTQIIQEKYSELEIRVVSSRPLSIGAQNKLIRNARHFIPKQIHIRLNLEEMPVRLPNGKMPMIVRTVASKISKRRIGC